jgi:hypothetical protein
MALGTQQKAIIFLKMLDRGIHRNFNNIRLVMAGFAAVSRLA